MSEFRPEVTIDELLEVCVLCESERPLVEYLESALGAKAAGVTVSEEMLEHVGVSLIAFGLQERGGDPTILLDRLDAEEWSLVLGIKDSKLYLDIEFVEGDGRMVTMDGDTGGYEVGEVA